MKFVKAKESKNKECVATMDVWDGGVILNIDGRNVFKLTKEGNFVVWEKHGLERLAEGKIPDLEEE